MERMIVIEEDSVSLVKVCVEKALTDATGEMLGKLPAFDHIDERNDRFETTFWCWWSVRVTNEDKEEARKAIYAFRDTLKQEGE